MWVHSIKEEVESDGGGGDSSRSLGTVRLKMIYKPIRFMSLEFPEIYKCVLTVKRSLQTIDFVPSTGVVDKCEKGN